MEEIKLEKVEKELATVNSEIAELRDKFWDMPEWNDEKEELQAKIEAHQEWGTKLEATRETIVVISNGGIAADIDTKINNQLKKPTYDVDLTRSERPYGGIRFVS
jgi:metal-dependent amidase/aminoacylase/carboxypeptidase family protein